MLVWRIFLIHAIVLLFVAGKINFFYFSSFISGLLIMFVVDVLQKRKKSKKITVIENAENID
ncbi:hypothetical protein D1606_17870 [Rummeliibacillus sp. POC4]|nr:hypothetical protein D1606_17870 [Rummeliibacillus sp. POC4]